jgi:hypothetical protein
MCCGHGLDLALYAATSISRINTILLLTSYADIAWRRKNLRQSRDFHGGQRRVAGPRELDDLQGCRSRLIIHRKHVGAKRVDAISGRGSSSLASAIRYSQSRCDDIVLIKY